MARRGRRLRRILERSGRVLAVFQGHSHQNDHQLVGGIHYCLIRAVVDGSGPAENGYAVANVYGDDSLRIEGFRKQADYDFKR